MPFQFQNISKLPRLLMFLEQRGVQSKPTLWFINTRIHQLINLQAHQLTNSQTYQLTSSSTYKPTNSSTHKLINLQAHQLATSSTLINSRAHKLVNLQAHQLTSPSTHQLKDLILLFLFYNKLLIFIPFQRENWL